MKKIYKVLLVITFTFLFMAKVDAKSYLELDCPSSAGTGKTISCKVYAKSDTNVEITNPDANGRGKVSNVTYKALRSEISGKQTIVGNVSVKLGSETGTAVITVSMNIGENYKETSESITVKSSSNTLSQLKVNGTSALNGRTISTKEKTATITAIASHNTSKISGTGRKKLSCGINTYNIKVTSQMGSTKTYKVTVNRTCQTNNNEQVNTSGIYLKNIQVSKGKLSPSFTKEQTNYTVEVNNNVDKITVTGVRNSSNQIVTGNVENKTLEYGTNTIRITVKQNGNQETYTVNVIRKKSSSSNNYLSTLSLSSGTIEFDKKTLEYKTEVPYDTEEIEILAIPESDTSKVTITGNKNLKLGENLITIKVKSENGKTRTYKITVNKLEQTEEKSNNASIKKITIKDHNFKFSPSKTDYRLIIDKENSLDITITMEDEKATYKIEGNENLKDGSIIKIITTAEDGTEKTYKIEITKNNYTVYYIIGAVLLLIIIAVPTIVYFVSVKPKEKKTDVNGYKEGKDYDEKDYSRKVIGKNAKKETLNKENSVIVNPKHLENPKSVKEPIKQNSFDEGLKEYVPNEEINQNNEQANQNNVVENNNQTNQNNTVENNNEQINQNNKAQQNNEQINPNNIVQLPTEEQIIEESIVQNKCPNCQRELLGTPDECPYCKTKLR